ncbi:MAG: hypothetical protein JWL83_3435 [Actinomycetia bacterium]|nr:hypothetical protein [Actinomycetes bacterium]
MGTGLAVVLIVLFVAPLVHVMYPATPPDFRNFGTVHTQFGDAALTCGGESPSGCGWSTDVRFQHCSSALNAFLGPASNRPSYAHLLARRLDRIITLRAPSGDGFGAYTCGGPPLTP